MIHLEDLITRNSDIFVKGDSKSVKVKQDVSLFLKFVPDS